MVNVTCENFVNDFISICQELTEFNLTSDDTSYLKKYLTNVNKR